MSSKSMKMNEAGGSEAQEACEARASIASFLFSAEKSSVNRGPWEMQRKPRKETRNRATHESQTHTQMVTQHSPCSFAEYLSERGEREEDSPSSILSLLLIYSSRKYGSSNSRDEKHFLLLDSRSSNTWNRGKSTR